VSDTFLRLENATVDSRKGIKNAFVGVRYIGV